MTEHLFCFIIDVITDDASAVIDLEPDSMSNMHGYHGRLNRLVDDILAANPDEAPTYYRYLAALRSGGFEAWYVDILLQEHSAPPDIYDAFWFAHLHTGLCVGDILWARIELGQQPLGDKLTEQNCQILRGLHKPFSLTNGIGERGPSETRFSAAFVGGSAGADGHLRWDGVLDISNYSKLNHVTVVRQLTSNVVPLEVGFVSMTTIVQHLLYARGVARWPYGSRYLTILYRENQTRWPAMDWSVGDESA
ncbi:MAG: hypothetical protein WAU95_18445 [Anaerolineae bacterium]